MNRGKTTTYTVQLSIAGPRQGMVATHLYIDAVTELSQKELLAILSVVVAGAEAALTDVGVQDGDAPQARREERSGSGPALSSTEDRNSQWR